MAGAEVLEPPFYHLLSTWYCARSVFLSAHTLHPWRQPLITQKGSRYCPRRNSADGRFGGPCRPRGPKRQPDSDSLHPRIYYVPPPSSIQKKGLPGSHHPVVPLYHSIGYLA